jgi:hypothetical protein
VFPTSGIVKEGYNPECLVATVKHGEVLWWFGQQYRGTVFCWSRYHHSWPNYCKGYVDRLGNQVHPMIQTLFPNNAVFQDDSVPIHTAWTVHLGFKSMKANFNVFPGQHNHHTWTSLNHSGQFWGLEWGADPSTIMSKAIWRCSSQGMV